jgi:anaerobic selenocysteine-containing dehydrogenase
MKTNDPVPAKRRTKRAAEEQSHTSNSPANSLLRQWSGPLTSDLTLHPADFGLGKVPAKFKPDATTTVVCGYCSTGCGLNIHLQAGRAVNLTPTTSYPVNLGMACPKGWEALSVLGASDRATTPLLRDATGKLVPVTWDRAMTTFTDHLKSVQAKHGAASVAFLSTGQIVTEEMAFLGALAKFGMGMIHGDGNTRQCMATAVTAYKESFGFDAPPYTYRDFEESDVLVFVGSNLCIAHPILWQRVLLNRNKPEIIVVDPRKTETAMGATQHYANRPKSDLKLLYGVANILIKRGWIDPGYIEQHTDGFESFKQHVRAFPPEVVAQASGLTVEQLHRFAETIHRGKRVSFWWTMGVNQSHEGTRVAQAIINLALMTGNIGRPGTGANSITGQCNAMGSRLFSNTTNLLGGHDFQKPADRQKVARILNLDVERIPDQNSWAYDQIIEGIATDQIKGLWVIATNTAHSWINQSALQKVFKKLEFLVVQDMYHSTETAQMADLILPAAGWGEKEGTFINSERRFGLVKKVATAPGEALSDFNIFKLAAAYWGCGPLFKDWTSPEAAFQLMKELSRGQPCDITGIRDYQMLDEAGGIQWPLPETASTRETERRLFEDGVFYHADGRARFIFEEPREMAEPTDASYPYLLLTGRGTSAQWHTQTRTAKSPVLRRLYPENIYAEINPEDAARAGIKPDSMVEIASRRGKVEARAFVTSTVGTGQVFIPMHYANANQLTYPAFDPYSRQPSYKACAVAVRPINPKRKR